MRAGLKSDHTLNAEVGSPVTYAQAKSRVDLEFERDAQLFMARYVSVELSGNFLHLTEVNVDEIRDTEMAAIGSGE